MPQSPGASVSEQHRGARCREPADVTELVDLLLTSGAAGGAATCTSSRRAVGSSCAGAIDGVLQPVHDAARMRSRPTSVARLKVLADLLTYRQRCAAGGPDPGRLGRPRDASEHVPHALWRKAVVRLFADPGRYQRLPDLGLPAQVPRDAGAGYLPRPRRHLLRRTRGSGKTTTIYACLRELVEQSAGQRSLATLEDPIEVAVPGVAQTQVNRALVHARDRPALASCGRTPR